ncbi:MAG: FHA domain-containing protein [Planctomycetaceae bacterium]|nr:FHA domain-containing protein [Planctomycetaceae bacterium]
MDIQISIFINNQLRATRVASLPCVVGRSRQATLTIGHPVVSRRHCELYLENDTVNLRDAGSLNGTYFKGELLSGSTLLTPGDSFRIGELTFVVNFQPPKSTNFGLVGPTPQSVASMPHASVLASDSSSALAPPSSLDIIDLATLGSAVKPTPNPQATAATMLQPSVDVE